MKLLERRLTLYEEKYGVLSEDFYTALMSGKLMDYDAYDESRADFSRWRGIFETLGRRKDTGSNSKDLNCQKSYAFNPPINHSDPLKSFAETAEFRFSPRGSRV